MLTKALGVLLGGVLVGASPLALQLTRSANLGDETAEAEIQPPTAILFEAAEATVNDEALRSIAAIARIARTSPLPVAVLPFPGPKGSADQGPALAQKRARHVRDALVLAGVPRARIIIVSPTRMSSDSPRVEVALVSGVRIFPAQAESTRLTSASDETFDGFTDRDPRTH